MIALTRQVGHRLQLLLPELGDLDGVPLVVGAVGRHPLLVGVLQDLLEVFGVDRVQDVEEVLPRRALAGWVLVGEVLDELVVLGELGPQVLDRELVVVRHGDPLHLGLLHQLLLAAEHVLEEVLVDDALVGQVVLDYIGVRL